jgi:hypothetical protein
MKKSISSFPTLILVLSFATQAAEFGNADGAFVRPGHDSPRDRAVWGHRDGLRIGIRPTRGPAGLIRIYTPYLVQAFPRVVNFLSIEPSVQGQRGRGQSELEMSRERPGERGLTFWASNEIAPAARPERLATGHLEDGGRTLRLFIHTEPFRNGACPVVECRFHVERPFEVELITHAAPESAAMSSCVISATMGNYGLLRRIHLKKNRVASALDLWPDEEPGRLGFYSWRTWPPEQLPRTPDGCYLVELSTDMPDPAAARHAPDVPRHWRYVGKKAVHYWRTEADADPLAAVNGRKTYWLSRSPIPGGVAFENFELRMAFKPGRRLWFGVRPD